MALADGQALHGGELMAAGRVGDLQGAYLLVAADNLECYGLGLIFKYLLG